MFDDYFIYAGYSYGFSTDYQTEVFKTNSVNKYNTFVMKYLFDKDNSYSCLNENEVNADSTVSSLCKAFNNLIFYL